jgi:hypothetical protein
MTRLPRRIPAGTKFVVEGEDTADGRLRIVARYLVYPDGTQLNVLAGSPRVYGRRDRPKVTARRHRRAGSGRTATVQ